MEAVALAPEPESVDEPSELPPEENVTAPVGVADPSPVTVAVMVTLPVLEMLARLQAEHGLTYLFITHDLAVVRQIADQVLVMAKGRVVEENATDALFADPQHEYTRNLLDAVPGRAIDLALLSGSE